MALWNRKYKDSVFTDLFGSDRDGKKNFLELYNALSGNDYKLNEVELERKIIEQALYKTFNNDVSWEINGKLIVLVEHQMLCMSERNCSRQNRSSGFQMHFTRKTAASWNL